MTRTEVVRHVAADPASVALLLSGPTAVTLWPDAQEDSVVFRTPMRSAVGFVVDLSVRDVVAGPARARLSIAPSDSPAVTTLSLVVTAAGTATELRTRAALFLDALARCAQSRSSAA